MLPSEIIILCIAAFAAGFIDAIIGGGGLVQTPATLVTLPQYAVATLSGTTKIPSFLGTSMAAYHYAKKVTLQKGLLFTMACISFFAAFSGSYLMSKMSNHFMKPVIFIVLVIVGLYTFSNKKFGTVSGASPQKNKTIYLSLLCAMLIGFYDGFIGPGTGSFLVLFFVGLLKFDFLQASAHAKFVNLATNMGSIVFFGISGHILWQYAIPMALFNLAGATIGSRLAILKGNQFIRIFFLLVIAGTIVRFGYDLFFRQG